MSNAKDIQRRIKSVKNTGKITRAMEMVSAVKMRKAISLVLSIRPYAIAALDVLNNLMNRVQSSLHPLLEVREVKNVLVVMITTNRGLCGSFNSHIMKKVSEIINNPESLKINRAGGKKIESNTPDENIKIDFITLGKKGESFIRKQGKEIIASFPGLVNFPAVADIAPLAELIIDEYSSKKYDKVAVGYVDYVSAVSQIPKIKQLLPISKLDIEKQIKEMEKTASSVDVKFSQVEYKIEQDPAKLLQEIIVRLIETQIYHAILESNASRESSRMMAMKNATESAKEMAQSLSLTYNQIRQSKITQEIAEISAGRAALE